ncbi:hypothetical protein P5673_007760, partial [Acropora cervicornis]
ITQHFHGIFVRNQEKQLPEATCTKVRPPRLDTVGGLPDVLFQLSEESGAFDCSVPVSKD